MTHTPAKHAVLAAGNDDGSGVRDGQPLLPFADFAAQVHAHSPLRSAITAANRTQESEHLPGLLAQASMPPYQEIAVRRLALQLASGLRKAASESGSGGLMQALVQEFSLSSQEGVALMCLAEALLRIPDSATRDALIRDKISTGDWRSHLGNSPSLFVNAATWGLVITGKLVATHNESSLGQALTRAIGKSGEPLIRKGVDMAMHLMGEQFVAGETIQKALANARTHEAAGFRYSYDMLGEAAVTAHDAQAYFSAYEQAIHAIGASAQGRGIYEGPGISIKLSALHPRYTRAQYGRVMSELYPRLQSLSLLARRYEIGINIDAEEAERLDISLDLLERLCFEPQLERWDGIGFVLQAYQKRCCAAVAWIVDLAQRSQRRLMVRLVKGAYWDSEIKRAQVDGLAGYPVFTRKVYTDVSYLACARHLLSAPSAVFPQFATHNAQTLAAIVHMAGPSYTPSQYEFQCLHGMGEALYQPIVSGQRDCPQRPCRIYAPVGTHETLLAYLVRRLLENGANTSFVNRIADDSIPIEALVADPVQSVEAMGSEGGVIGAPHPRIPLPDQIYGTLRKNSGGLDFSDETSLARLAVSLELSAKHRWRAGPMLEKVRPISTPAPEVAVLNPADHADIVGHVLEANAVDVEDALAAATTGASAWQAVSPALRADVLNRAADQLQLAMPLLMGLIVREAGKTLPNAVGEVREAIDFLRYYAAQVRSGFCNDTHRALGPVVCVSPWNFPLAIFVGQLSAALAAGNSVLAKPAEQTPLIAAKAVEILWAAGVPRNALQLLPGRGETVGAQLVADHRVRGVLFTGSAEVAHVLQRSLAGRLDERGHVIPLVAETGGQNAMIVDSSALLEQVVADVIHSSFDSAGQRCSALRVLCVQEDVADRLLQMLAGAMNELTVGNPQRLDVDVGPVIDATARSGLLRHIEVMRDRGRRIVQSACSESCQRAGTFVPLTLIQIETFDELTEEVFGPVLHVLRYPREQLGRVLADINASGYGLTMGLHTRIDETVEQVAASAHVGNLYVNRNVVGAVVGVQPFGGEGLSGTGPKAGGPLYLLRLLATMPHSVIATLEACGTEAAPPGKLAKTLLLAPLDALIAWADPQRRALANVAQRFRELTPAGFSRVLAGPTGERNVYSLVPREKVLCIADSDEDLLMQLAATLAVGSIAVWTAQCSAPARELLASLPPNLQSKIEWIETWRESTFDAVIHHGTTADLKAFCVTLAQRGGAIVSVQALARGDTQIKLERLMIERVLSINTAAAGGNASLMTVA